MKLEPALQILRYHQSGNWPERSSLVTGTSFVSLHIDVGSETEPVQVVVRVSLAISHPVVDIAQGQDHAKPIGEFTEVGVITRLGGTLVQVSNMVDQLRAMEAPNATG